MAIYEYEILNSSGAVIGIYETEQKMSEPALTAHPVTGQPLRRILSATFAHGSRTSSDSSCSSGACDLGGSYGAGNFGAGNFGAGGCCGGGGCGLN